MLYSLNNGKIEAITQLQTGLLISMRLVLVVNTLYENDDFFNQNAFNNFRLTRFSLFEVWIRINIEKHFRVCVKF